MTHTPGPVQVQVLLTLKPFPPILPRPSSPLPETPCLPDFSLQLQAQGTEAQEACGEATSFIHHLLDGEAGQQTP
jgi:hypothetical protein